MGKIGIIMVAMTLLIVGKANAQESTVLIPSFNISSSIIRSIDADNKLVYSERFSKRGFTLIPSSGTNAIDMRVEVDTVCDFEIMDDFVYFCGRIQDNNRKQAFMGIFPLADIPVAGIDIYMLPDLYCLTELEIKYYNSDKHVIMIGVDSTGIPTLVDAWWCGHSWYFSMLRKDPTKLFNDIALCDDYIVATATDGAITLSGRTWFYPTPPPLSNAFLLGSVLYAQRSYPLSSLPLKVERFGTHNTIVVEYEGFPSNNIVLTWYNAATPMSCINLSFGSFGSREKVKICDTKFDFGEQKFDLLVEISDAISNYTKIYDMDLPTIFFGGTANVWSCNTPSHIQSIDQVPGLPNLFVTSGYGNSTQNLLNFNYDSSQQGTCSNVDVKEVYYGECEWDTKRENFSGGYIRVNYKRINGIEKIYDKNTLCNSKQEN